MKTRPCGWCLRKAARMEAPSAEFENRLVSTSTNPEMDGWLWVADIWFVPPESEAIGICLSCQQELSENMDVPPLIRLQIVNNLKKLIERYKALIMKYADKNCVGREKYGPDCVKCPSEKICEEAERKDFQELKDSVGG